MKRKIILSLFVSSALFADTLNQDLMGFDDSALSIVEKKDVEQKSSTDEIMDGFDDENTTKVEEKKTSLIEGLTGKFTEQIAYSYGANTPHDKFTSLKSSLLLDYEHKFSNGWRIKTNAKWYYDAVYDLRDEVYSNNELKEQRHESEIFDAYIEGSITDTLDVKLGRQVVVWGRSDTIRITDVLNPLDNRRPGMVDIEDLRLPVGMVKADYFMGDWRVTPIAIVEKRFSKNPAFGSAFNPMQNPYILDSSPTDTTYALSIGGEFAAWDVNFYGAHIYDDAGYVKFGSKPRVEHEKVDMAGTALNVLSGAWLLKMELAYFDGLKYTATQKKEFSRTDALVGLEYKGIADTLISYDVSLRHINSYDNRLLEERVALEEDTYQHAFRVSSDFMNATLTANYLISLYGKKLDEGGFQRLWVKYELAEGLNLNVGVVDYMGGSKLFDSIKDNDMLFADISYSF
jgi:hypothetical protein